MNFKKFKPKKGHVLVLKSVPSNMIARNNFKWPESGRVECDDWKETEECGNGLHGWRWGEGEASLRGEDEDAKWLIVEVENKLIVDLKGKVKFPFGVVLFVGELADCVAIIQNFAPTGNRCIFGTSTSGDRGTATAGERGTSTSGDGGTSTSGYLGTSTSGYLGTATAGDGGTSTSGERGTATSGDGGTATAGDGGFISIFFYDNGKYNRKIACVDGVNIMPNVAYCLDENAVFIVKE